MRRNRRLWLSVLATFGALAGAAGARATTVDFTVPCTPANFVGPAGVTSVTIDARGAQGGSSANAIGGRGGHATATITVTPGETLQVNVGGQGATTGTTEGCNGGGTSGGGISAGGGGASDVRQGGTALAKRVVIGGGGGGATIFSGGDGGGQAAVTASAVRGSAVAVRHS